jgi:uncharacterized membrane protein YtjA (UPF0391 family)
MAEQRGLLRFSSWHGICNEERGEEGKKEETMLSWALAFFILAVLAAVFGFTGIAGAAASIAQILFFVFLVLLIVSAIAGALRGRPPI